MNDFQYFEQIKTFGSKRINKRTCYLIICEKCEELHYKAQCEILRGLRNNKKFFCSHKCYGDHYSTKQKVSCANCSIIFVKLLNQISRTNNNFCSKSCSATFNNKHKKYGTRRSKLEVLIEKMLLVEYPALKFSCNKKDDIGSELDFYFQEILLAIQINGPLHYKPIYGDKKLIQIQKMDEEKRANCISKNIKLIEIDCSEDKYLIKIEERLNQVRKILVETLYIF